MRTYLLFSLLFLFVYNSGISQKSLMEFESELTFHCDVMANASEGKHRVTAHNAFLTGFEKALSQPGAFQYPFDSLKWISIKTPEDKSFRIITWELRKSEYVYVYYGFLQMADGKVFKLTDKFKEAESLQDEEFTPENWLGSMYYNIMEMNPEKGEKYYLVFGINRWDRFENVKVVDVLFFAKSGAPIFGKPVFRKGEKNESDVFYNRLLFKYASDAQMTVNYNPGMEMIVYDNLIPKMSRIPGHGETLVPDGSYVGYTWDKKYWNRINKIATQVMDTAPRPNPVLDQRKGKKIFGNKG